MSLIKVIEGDDDAEMLLLTSSSDEEEDLNVLYTVSQVVGVCAAKFNKTVPSQNFCTKIVPSYLDETFNCHFRVKRALVEIIIMRFGQSDVYQALLTETSRANIDPQKHVLAFLWFAGQERESYREIANRFDICLSSLHDVISRMSSFLSSLFLEFIKFSTEEEKTATSTYYRRHKQFPNIIGCIDSTHIKIEKPRDERAVDYYNHKKYYSIVVQGICDHKKRLLDVCIGFPGTVHDARVYRNSPISRKIEHLCGQGRYIIGDTAYTTLPNLITPYRDNGRLSSPQKYFNERLNSCHVSIKHTFRLLKERFRRLNHLKLRGTERICHFIRAICVLYNWSYEDGVTFDEESDIEDDQPDTQSCCFRDSDYGIDTRNKICQKLYMNRVSS